MTAEKQKDTKENAKKPDMPKKYNPKELESGIYKMWEEKNVFSPEGAQKLREDAGLPTKEETFCVLMPPPNANAPLHCGHATYAIQDLMTRFRRMQGYKTLYVPGTDHAGFETQVVYERNLKKEGKSRFNFDRETLFKKILNFVKENSDLAVNQLKSLGMSADWNRNTFMLDEEKVIEPVLETFKKMHEDGLVYRDVYMVNYSPHHGTTFSNLETTHIEKTSPLYYVSYKFADDSGKITVATTRPETIYADVAIAVNPKDSKYGKLVGRKVVNPLNNEEIPVIADTHVDLEFGTGALKITPGHDFTDFEVGRAHNLEMRSVIDLEGKMVDTENGIDGLLADDAREKVAEILREKGALEKIDEKYTNSVLVDYKDQKTIEPLLLPNWFIKMTDEKINLADMAINAIESEKVNFNSETWKNESLRWLREIHDWPVSRQIVFGIRIPVWYDAKENKDIFVVFLDKEGNHMDGRLAELTNKYSLEEIESGLQKLIAPVGTDYKISRKKPGENYLQETDTFDTWFSSGQWPMTTLGFDHAGNHSKDFKDFHPTSFMDSMWDILFFWIARMIMFSLYLTDGVPYKDVYIHGMITDEKGQKMSKSKGNVIDPMEVVEEYGADALRMGIMVGGNTAARETSLSLDKVRGYRNFANKIWNMARFMNIMFDRVEGEVPWPDELESDWHEEDKKIMGELSELIEKVTGNLEKYNFGYAGDDIYHFMWDRVASEYIEHVKDREDKVVALSVLRHVFVMCLKMLHPYMPFVTEAIWEYVPGVFEKPLAIADWPEVK